MNMREYIAENWILLFIVAWFALVAAVAVNDSWHRRPASAGVEVRP